MDDLSGIKAWMPLSRRSYIASSSNQQNHDLTYSLTFSVVVCGVGLMPVGVVRRRWSTVLLTTQHRWYQRAGLVLDGVRLMSNMSSCPTSHCTNFNWTWVAQATNLRCDDAEGLIMVCYYIVSSLLSGLIANVVPLLFTEDTEECILILLLILEVNSGKYF